MNNTLLGQTISLTGPSEVNSTDLITFSVSGESSAQYVTSIILDRQGSTYPSSIGLDAVSGLVLGNGTKPTTFNSKATFLYNTSNSASVTFKFTVVIRSSSGAHSETALSKTINVKPSGGNPTQPPANRQPQYLTEGSMVRDVRDGKVYLVFEQRLCHIENEYTLNNLFKVNSAPKHTPKDYPKFEYWIFGKPIRLYQANEIPIPQSIPPVLLHRNGVVYFKEKDSQVVRPFQANGGVSAGQYFASYGFREEAIQYYYSNMPFFYTIGPPVMYEFWTNK